MDSEESRTDNSGLSEKPYHSPTFYSYGDIREITQRNGGTMGKNDGGAGVDKTGF